MPPPARPDRLAALRRADARYRRAQVELAAAVARRKVAMAEAHWRGATLSEIAEALGVKHEIVRRSVREVEAEWAEEEGVEG